MRVELRKLSNGKEYYSFVYWDGEKRIRLKKEECPHFESREKAEEWARAKEAELNSAKSRILRRLKWKSQYYEFTKLSDEYVEYCKRTQPNSWKNSKFDLEHYVLPYFLDVKKSNNVNYWSLHFEDYRRWLEEDAYTISKNKRLISYSTKNQSIKTLNTFLEFLRKKNLIDPVNVIKVKSFPTHKIGQRNASHLISNEEFRQVLFNLNQLDPVIATLFECAYWTGMRFNELMGLSLDDLYIGEVKDQTLNNILLHNKIEHYGYIVLESQPTHKSLRRDKDGHIERKPLKGKPKIDTKFDRVIPIINKDLFNNLVRLYKNQEENLNKMIYGTNDKDYLLFDSMSCTKANSLLKKAFEQSNLTPKSYHCCRHTRCTELVGKTGDFLLAKYWLGHSRVETTTRYTHVFQQSVNMAKKKVQKIDYIS